MLPIQRASLSLKRSLKRDGIYLGSRAMSSLKQWATLDPEAISGANPATGSNLVNGSWQTTKKMETIVDPMNGEPFLKIPQTEGEELRPFIQKMKEVPKHGLHNPLKNVDRYLHYGQVSFNAAAELAKPEVVDFFAKLIMRTSPKSYAQAVGEVTISRVFLQNYSGDQVRFLAESKSKPGDHQGQFSTSYRWPYGPVAIVTPFNFPLEIPILQLLAALYMGNHVTLKVDSKVAIVMDQALRMLIHCGLPIEDVNFINGTGSAMNKILLEGEPRNTLFTGSAAVAEKLAKDLHGRIKIEDAGFDWKILGPDVNEIDYAAWVSDQDAYACTGQKCSAQSILFMHENWRKAGFVDKITKLASRRNLKELTVGPVLTVTTERFLNHVDALLKIPGAKVLFGGKALENHKIPKIYGAVQPTAVFVPLDQLADEKNFELCTTEIFGPMQVVTEWKDNNVDTVLHCLEKMKAHLTAAVVSNDVLFQQKVLAHSVNGTTYVGLRARTTGAPQNHWFGPCGDPRAGALGPPEAIKLVWSSQREIITDIGPLAKDWKTPKAT